MVALESYLASRAFDGVDAGKKGVIVVFTNAGYVDYTCNFVESLRRLQLDHHLALFCTEETTRTLLKQRKNVDAFVFGTQRNRRVHQALTNWNKGQQWASIVRTKIEVVHAVLALGYEVLFSDGDIVWLQDPIPLIQRSLSVAGTKDRSLYARESPGPNEKEGAPLMAFQLDTRYGADDALCTGFFYVRSTPTTVSVFDPRHIPASFARDQPYVNRRIRSLRLLDRIACLPRPLFPNGKWWYENERRLTWNNEDDGSWSIASGTLPFVIHFNWVLSKEKRIKMAQCGLWFD